MKITWTFYPKNQASICLELIYDYRLDTLALDCGGVINRIRNVAVVDWKTFSVFNKGNNEEKKAAFAKLADAANFAHPSTKDWSLPAILSNNNPPANQ